MNYEQLDLNLLRVFNAVMTEQHVTRASQQLHMTQPAVSNALNRLRSLLDDELFVKVPGGVRPTLKAIELWPPIRDALAQIRQALEPNAFSPETDTATFTVAMNDLVAHLLLPKLVTVLETLAPGVDIHTIPTTNINAATMLEQADIDLAIGVFPEPSSRLRLYSLLSSPFTCVMRYDHLLSKQLLTTEEYVQAKHLLVTLTGETTGFIDILLQEMGLKRHIMLTVNQFSIAPQIVAESDLLAVLPVRLVEMSSFADQLHAKQLPIEISPSTLKMMWHERNHLDSAQIWLRSQIIALFNQF